MTTSIDVYISEFPPAVQERLRSLRDVVRTTVPRPTEQIGYAIVSVLLDDDVLLYWGAWKNYVGLYPVPALSDDLERRVAPFRHTVDALKFPHAEEFPIGLIAEVVAELVARHQPTPAGV